MIEKVLPFVLTAAIIIMGLGGAGSSVVAAIPAATTASAADAVYPQIMNAIGEDLAAQAQAEGFNLDVSVAYFTGPGALEVTSVSVELRSAVGTAMYDSNTVNWELMRDIQLAIIDSGVFEFTPEELETARSTYYTPDNRSEDIDFSTGVNLHINETPFGYEAILYLRHNNYDLEDYYTREYSVSYDWNGVTYDSRN